MRRKENPWDVDGLDDSFSKSAGGKRCRAWQCDFSIGILPSEDITSFSHRALVKALVLRWRCCEKRMWSLALRDQGGLVPSYIVFPAVRLPLNYSISFSLGVRLTLGPSQARPTAPSDSHAKRCRTCSTFLLNCGDPNLKASFVGKGLIDWQYHFPMPRRIQLPEI